jgi:hypothetical protein
MLTLPQLEVTRLFSSEQGIFAAAHYSGWNHEYKFLLRADGSIHGRTSSGFWQLLSPEGADIIRAKIQNILADQSAPIFAE